MARSQFIKRLDFPDFRFFGEVANGSSVLG